MSRPLTALVGLLAFALALLAACGQQGSGLAYACATLDRPPIAQEPERCERQEPGVIWYSAPPADVADPDEQPVTGQELDGDWWDAADRAETARPPVAVPPSVAPTSTQYVPSRPTSKATSPAAPTTSRRPR